MQRVRLDLGPDEYRALVRLSERDIRPVPDQVRFLVRQAVEAAGLLPPAQAATRQPATGGRAS